MNNLMEHLCEWSPRKSRSISPENITGEKGKGATTPVSEGSAGYAARDLGLGWKVNPYFVMSPGETLVLGEVRGMGAIKHIWITPPAWKSDRLTWRKLILRMYWDDSDVPSVECPLGDFFASGWCVYSPLSSLAVCVNPGSAFNCYWTMPFRKGFRITLENMSAKELKIFYQINYELKEIPENAGYFHAFFNRVNPLPYKQTYPILSGVKGKGSYVGTYVAWGVNNNGWWGEGEVKFYMDGDREFPTICTTGTEDYFCGSYSFENPVTRNEYLAFSTPYAGFHQVIEPNRLYSSQFRFGMYRWHLTDSICFEEELRVELQALGWRDEGRYLPLQDDISSVAYFYLDHPSREIPKLPNVDQLEII